MRRSISWCISLCRLSEGISHAPEQSMEQENGMPQSVYPLIEVVVENGQPMWQVCGSGLCVRNKAGSRALEMFWALCQSRGLPVPQ
jgi:hypothetical protein